MKKQIKSTRISLCEDNKYTLRADIDHHIREKERVRGGGRKVRERLEQNAPQKH